MPLVLGGVKPKILPKSFDQLLLSVFVAVMNGYDKNYFIF